MTTPEENKKTSGSEAAESALTIVGIGASAGGLEALKVFFQHLPPDSGLAIVVVVHLSPEHESHMAEILQPHVPVSVQQVTETTRIEPNRVYLIPPNANLDAVDTHLRLSKLEVQRRERAPIDHFFRTLARTHKGRSVAIILSGTGTDGTNGLSEIKEANGLTVVQDPQQAEYDGMPRSAVASGKVDLVLSLTEMPEAIIRFARTEPRVSLPEESGSDNRAILQKILAKIRTETERDFGLYKRSTILRRIARRMQLHHVEKLEAYLEVLRADTKEVRELADDLLITVTNFFRDPEVFELVEAQVIPRLFDEKSPEESVRVWSVGCSTGEEPYSLAMLLLEESARREARGEYSPRLQVFASDLHEVSLQTARAGVYPEDIDAHVSEERLERFFHKESGGYRVRKELRNLVVFAPHNLLGDPPFSKLDLIVCRNLLIYLERDAQRNVTELFHYALNPGGRLLLGISESVTGTDLFKAEDKKRSLFRKRNVPAPEPRLPVFPLVRAHPFEDVGRKARREEPMSYGALHHQMVERYAPASLLVNADDKVVHLSEHVGRYLVHPGGEMTANLFKLVREELRTELRSALEHTRQQEEPVRTNPVVVSLEGETRRVVLDLRRAPGSDVEGFVLVIFDDRGEEHARRLSEDTSEGRTQEVQIELDRARQRLQAVIEKYEATQEELKASNEELQSANEELRSTLEELETSKEELQSMNEELLTVNQEHLHKVEELGQLASDLQNLLAATDIATLFMDRDLRILRFTPKIAALFNVRPVDCGRPLADFTHRLGYHEFNEDAREVLETLVPIEHEVTDEVGRWYLTRMLPYRSIEDRIEGVVVTFVDITERKHIEETLEERVEERTQEVRDLARRLTMAEQEERRRISQILHDDLQQLLYGVEMKMSLIGRDLLEREDGDLSKDLEDVRDWVSRAVTTTRQLTVDLSPPILQQEGLADTLQWLERQMKELHGLDVSVEAEHAFRIEDEDLRVLLFQIVRELLFNVKKHAGTDKVMVRLTDVVGPHEAPFYVIHVIDEGEGFESEDLSSPPQEAGGFGLYSIQERLRLYGGRLEVQSTPGEGTHIRIYAPVK